MSYKIDNQEMAFLNKLADEFEKLEQEVPFLNVEMSDIPKAHDRNPYNAETEVSAYPFWFSYKGKNFDVHASKGKEFLVEIIEATNGRVVKTCAFSMKEKTSSLKKMWIELLNELAKTYDLKEQPRYYFYKWCSRQGISECNLSEKDSMCDTIYQLLGTEIASQEIENRLWNRYSKQRNRIDRKVENRVANELGVHFYTLLDGLRYFVVNRNEAFMFQTKEQAYAKFEEETSKNLKENLANSFETYERVQKMIDEEKRGQ